MRTPTRRRSGFTLLETMVAMAILSVALMAIFDLNSGAVANHVYTKRLTVASLLSRSKMTDLEQKLYDDGFEQDDDEQSGDFSDEGWPQFKWRARIIAPKTDGVTPDQLIGAIFNLPMGGGDSGDPLGGLASLFGGGAGGDSKGGSTPPGGTTTASPMGASAMSMAQPMFTQMVDQLTKSVREVHLTVYWKEGTQVESVDVVTHVVSLGPGGDRNGGFTPNAGSTAGAENQWVNPRTGAVVDNPIPGENGQMLDPNTREPLVNRAAVLNQLNGANGSQGGGNGNTGINPRAPGGIFGGRGFPGMPGRGGTR
ncbi:type IV pilus modification PilV family protein [Corallococcus carmarthensis]|uniref:Prepilin-type N-terminal cleavage/methylation domain-containing protein n=1 Tax=Corallococcus carmarthensis TaxID=2316728 RepID=A0A3A8JVB7_9BACT|nr:prepilin-type N-terminal cleavage/methylation domain-containing protein [Corallococcus carmarthensis]NOK19327.1 prepilin-type N-terminal cleavage/methylation domain-containing protein [Corallococcus carmarthensis]RKG99857.1 prepilin-type N-terminal cleavage/methylation domain-containing protein [Corallococcus carmarthensis]